MTAPIDVEAWLERLEAALQDWLRALPGDMPRVAAESLDRMAIRPGRPPQWTRRLSPLVCLYPALQAQALADVAPSRVEDLTLAHLQLTMHAFLSDRQLDGQLALRPGECVLSTQALLAGITTLDHHAVDAAENRIATLRALRALHHAQLAAYPAVHESGGDDEQVFRRVADRAVVGWLATGILTESAPQCGRAKEAYDELVVGLQWVDDLLDWSRDLDDAQENLLLRQLELPLGELVTIRDVDLEPRLIAEGVYRRAFDRIDRHLKRALTIHAELGSSQLAGLVDDVLTETSELEARLTRLIHGGASGSGS